MIALLTDFGNSEYVGIVKGVLYSYFKEAKIVDLCNSISSQNIKEGAWILLKSYKFFPKKTIFLCIIDPGVGGKREGIAIQTKNYFFIGPDNGLMFPAAHEDQIIKTIKLKNGKNISRTFHGRDVFAKDAAKLDNNKDINRLGEKSEIKKKIEFYNKNGIGEVVRIDNFGNVITNLQHINKKEYILSHKDRKFKMRFYENYESAQEKNLFLINGSSNTLEISIKNGNASNLFKTKVGDKIKIS